MHKMSSEMQSCIDECLRCYQTCLGMLMSHCLEAGGKHMEPGHVRIMQACAEMCRTSAAMMLIGTEHHKHTCRECAEICAQCAEDCDRLGQHEEMRRCAEACRRCAESCRAMAGTA